MRNLSTKRLLPLAALASAISFHTHAADLHVYSGEDLQAAIQADRKSVV